MHREIHGPIWFGPAPGEPPLNRFDAPSGEYRIMYAAASLRGAFAETILRNEAGNPIIAPAAIGDRSWTTLRLRRPVRVALLHGEGLFAHGVDAGITTGTDYGAARGLAMRLHGGFPDLDGLVYRSRHDNDELCYALFDRVDEIEFEPVATHRLLDHVTEVRALAAVYGAILDVGEAVPPLD